jgi:tRNA (adenine57-N1/adenine58-N1)-methyltransferase
VYSVLNISFTITITGTGSGSLSHAILRAIAPKGHLHTFDFHQQRVEIVTKEFADHGLGDSVTVRQRDACKDGFDLVDTADAVFLDLPSPWLAVPHAAKALKQNGGRICSFSPCIEQVQKTCDSLIELGFQSIDTFECLQREFQIKNMTLPEVNDYSNFSFDPDTPAATAPEV